MASGFPTISAAPGLILFGQFAGRLKGAATKQLRAEGLDPMWKYQSADGEIPSFWSVKPWVVYQFTDADMRRSIDYVLDNVKRARLPTQSYPFVEPYATRG